MFQLSVKPSILFFFIFLFQILSLSSLAETKGQSLNLTPETEQNNLIPYLDYFHDSSGKLNISNIVNLKQTVEFKPLSSTNISMGSIPGAFWLRFKLAEQPVRSSKSVTRWLLDMDRPLEQDIKLYIPLGQNQWHIINSCPQKPCDENTRFRLSLFELPEITDAPKTFYVRIVAPTAMFFFPKILTEDAFRKKDNIRMLTQGLYFGLAIAMILYSLSNFIFIRDTTYLWYVLYMLFMGLYFSVAYGLSIRFIHFLNIETLIRLDLISLALTSVVACQFTRSFLMTPKNLPGADKFILSYMVVALLIGIMSSFIEIRTVLNFFIIIGGMWPFVTIPPAVIILKQGFRPARFILLGWVLFSISVFIFSLSYDGRIPQNIWSFHSILIGSALEILCFAFALGHRLAVLRKEKDALLVSSSYYKKASLVDDLTGLFNRRGYDMYLKREIATAHGMSKSLCLLVIDVDNFKKFNDSYGHDNGDKVLKALGKLLNQIARKTDAACRYGGEEFTLILPETIGDQAVKIADRLREKLNEKDFPEIGDGTIHCSVSIGVADLTTSESPEGLFKRADKALYQAKEEGRNRTVMAGQLSK